MTSCAINWGSSALQYNTFTYSIYEVNCTLVRINIEVLYFALASFSFSSCSLIIKKAHNVLALLLNPFCVQNRLFSVGPHQSEKLKWMNGNELRKNCCGVHRRIWEVSKEVFIKFIDKWNDLIESEKLGRYLWPWKGWAQFLFYSVLICVLKHTWHSIPVTFC